MDSVCFDERRRSNNSSNIGSPRKTSVTGGTKFCLVAVPSPKMQRQVNTSTSESDDADGSSVQKSVKKPTDVTLDNRIRNPAYDPAKDRRTMSGSKADNANGNGDSSRIGRMLQTLRTDLRSLQQQDQDILRQFLNIYQTISDLHCGESTPIMTPSPEPAQVFQFQGSAALSPAIMADEVRDLVSYQGHLNIRDVVSRLSPIKRQRTTSEPFLDDNDESLSLENSTEDLLSLSSPFL